MISIGDILGPLEQDRISILSSSRNLKIRGLASSFFRFKIPLESTNGKQSFKALLIEPQVPKVEKIIIGLLWHALFGKKFKVLHWFILFHVLIRTIAKDKNSEALLAILMIMTANAATSNWLGKMKPLRSILVAKYGKDRGEAELEELMNKLPFRLPRKVPKIDEIVTFRKTEIRQKKPKEPARIGVGYKDKGGLNGPGVVGLDSDVFENKDDIFVDLVRQIRAKYSNVLHD